MKKFLKYIDKILVCGIGVFLGLVLAIITWVCPASTKIPIYVLVIFVLIAYLALIILYAVLMSLKVGIYRLPNVINIEFYNKEPFFIVEPNTLYGQGALLTIVYQEDEDGVEIVLGIGYAETVNNKGYLQVRFESIAKDKAIQDIVKKIEPKTKKYIKIKPYITKQAIQKYEEE